ARAREIREIETRWHLAAPAAPVPPAPTTPESGGAGERDAPTVAPPLAASPPREPALSSPVPRVVALDAQRLSPPRPEPQATAAPAPAVAVLRPGAQATSLPAIARTRAIVATARREQATAAATP